jgi:ATP-binding cassette subfamily B protein
MRPSRRDGRNGGRSRHQGRSSNMATRGWGGFRRLFAGSRIELTTGVLLSIAQAALLVPVAVIVGRVFDELIPRGDEAAIVLSGLIIFVLYVASSALGLVTAHVVLKATRRTVTRLRGDLIERVVAFPRAWFDRTQIGTLHSTIVQDSDRVDAMVNVVAGKMLPALTVSAGLSAILVFLNPLLFAVLALIVPAMIATGRIVGRTVRARMRKLQRAFDDFSTGTQRTLRTITLVKVQGAERPEVDARRAEHAALGRATMDVSWVKGAYTIVQSAVAAGAGIAVLVVGGVAASRGQMSLGELVSFYAVLALLLRQVGAVVSGVPHVLAGQEAVRRLDDLLDADDAEPYDGTTQIDHTGAIELERVSFGYGTEPVLQDLDLRIGPGERVAIFGPNGSGKTTLANLVLGLYRPDGGRLLADGIPYDDLDATHLRRSMGVVLQEPIIFRGSVAENIAYGYPSATAEQICRAAEWAMADAFIEALPHGYDTDVGDEGGLLSGGQRQRIAIARALLARPSLLVLDEPTSHLDEASVAALLARIGDLPGAPAVLLISHDVEVAPAVDTIYHLRRGRLVRAGRTARAALAPA